jgi:hypothetical protein
MKQTAVDWLESKIIQMVNHGSDFGEDFPALAVHLNKAKEMEKQQIENAYDKGQESEWHKSMGLMGDHYYNETFNAK